MASLPRQSTFIFAGAQTGLPFRIKIQVNCLIPEYMKMSRIHVGLGRADQIKARDHRGRNRARREKGMRPFLRGPRIKEQVKNELE